MIKFTLIVIINIDKQDMNDTKPSWRFLHNPRQCKFSLSVYRNLLAKHCPGFLYRLPIAPHWRSPFTSDDSFPGVHPIISRGPVFRGRPMATIESMLAPWFEGGRWAAGEPQEAWNPA
jgi:hypothetical protein